MKNLEKRMYFLVLSSLCGISKGIMCGHAALEYAYRYGNDPDYIDFIENWKTWIILNGGTSNSKYDYGVESPRGSLDMDRLKLLEQKGKIKFSVFHEPDLNDALTAICLIVDERVFNRKDYPDFEDWAIDKIDSSFIKNETPRLEMGELYKVYEKTIGSDILFLKDLLNTKRLA